ncbi:ABC transporter transmembrane domain-containing protein [Paenibacillus sp.]|uniref:ABC transporter transmembrane domain-containing protein n=1 Tax=Paenibacillus sp. TaxID=58172 RepID=UPI002D592B1A|nr:ABC transporter transmembrane domain-containing protein [Paenibacillus sp.]HZG58874.1 ABC transporter transmembrane domain-containing protein [Paenibacillus sp.]
MLYIFKVLPAFFRRYKKASAVLVAALLVELAFETLLPVSFKIVVDYAILPQNFQWLLLILGALLVGAVAAAGMGVLRDRTYASIGPNVMKDMHEKLFRHIQSMSMEFFSRRGAGDLLARFNSDLSSVDSFVMMLPYVLLSFLGLFLNVVVLFLLQWQLALVAVLGLPLCLVGPKLFGKRAYDANYELKEEQAGITGTIQENLGAQTVVKAFGLQDRVNGQFAESMERYVRKASRSHFFSFLVDRTTNLGTVVLNLIAICIGSVLAFNGHLSIGSLLAFSTILLTLSNLVAAVTWIVPQMMQASAGMERIDEILNERPAVTDAPDAIELPPLSDGIEFRGVTFGYTPQQVNLSNIDLRIPYGSYAAFVGSSGSGKSTIINLLMRFYDPREGSVRYDGHDIAKVTQQSLRSQISIVFQDNFLFNISLRENIRLGNPAATDEDVERAARAAEIHDFILSLPEGYDTLAGERGSRLSGGQRQRIGIARAMARNPRLLILDEATSALDPATEEAVNQTIYKLARTTTVVSITHRLASAESADRIFVLDKGRLVEQGTHPELLAVEGGKYAAAWEKQSGFSISDDGIHAVIQPAKLKKVPLFENVDLSFLEEIAPLFITESFPTGKTIIQEGDQGDKFYIVVRGKVEVSKVIDGKDTKLAVLSDGDFFGEVALLRNVARTATVTSLSPTMFITLSRESFRHIVDKEPDLQRILSEARG